MSKTTKTILITAGPTVEAIDPVRYLSNRSSGKMGYALAQAALDRGHNVILISGPTHLAPPQDCDFIAVKTAIDMEKAVLRHFKKADVILKAAAVADYRPAHPTKEKIKKKSATLTLKLIPNPDILKQLGKLKRKNQTLVGFAAETNDAMKNALKKIKEKNLDFIVMNDVSKPGIGFESNDNAVTLISKTGVKKKFPKQSKIKLAQDLIAALTHS